MELINKYIDEIIDSCILFKEDLEEIINYLNSISCKNIDIIINNYKINDLSEISNSTFDKINYLKITTDNPYIIILYTGKYLSVYINQNDEYNKGVFLNLKKILEKNRNNTIVKIKNIINDLAFIPAVIYAVLSISKEIFSINYFIITLVLTIGGYIYISKVNTSYCKVYNVNKKESLNFLKRNKDSLIIGLFFLIISSIIGYFLK